MAWMLQNNWQPTRLLEIGGSADTSTGATEVTTDAGRAYIKTMGNRQSPHVLATDWVGTHLARWIGLSTFEIALLTLTADDAFPLPRGYIAQPGPAFAARAVEGGPWGRTQSQLKLLVNPEDLTRLVVFDTWTLNCDRHFPDPNVRRSNYDNVFLSSEGVAPGKLRLIAMDHGLCFIRSGEDLTPRLAHIEKVKEERVYGLFPEFREMLQAATIDECVKRLGEMDAAIADAIIATVPSEWDVSTGVRQAWSELIVQRSVFLADNMVGMLETAAPWFRATGD